MIDEANIASLEALTFVKPITVADVEKLVEIVRGMTWSSTAKLDALFQHDASQVTLTIYVGGNVYKKVFHGV